MSKKPVPPSVAREVGDTLEALGTRTFQPFVVNEDKRTIPIDAQKFRELTSPKVVLND